MFKLPGIAAITVLFFVSGQAWAQQPSAREIQQIDSVKKILTNTNLHDSIRLRASIDYADLTTNVQPEFWDSLAKACEKYIAKYETIPSVKRTIQKAQGEILNNHGYFCKKKGMIQSALASYKASIWLREELKEYQNLASTYNSIGILSLEIGELAQAHDYLEKSLKIKTSLNDQRGMVNTLNSIGGLYQEQYNFEKALEYYEKSLELARKLQLIEAIANTLDNIGVAYIEKREFKKAIASFEEAIKLWQELNETWGMAYCYANIGSTYREQKNYTKAKEYYAAAQERFTQVKSKKGMTSCLFNFGQIAYIEKSFEKANDYFKEALLLSKESGNSEDIKNSNRWLHRTQMQLDQPESAIVHLSAVMRRITQEINNNYFTFPEREKEIYFNRLEDDFMRYYDFAHINHTIYPALADTCFNYSLRNKGLLLKSSTALVNSIHKSKDSALLSTYNNWMILKKDIAKLYAKSKNTKELEEKALTLEQEIIKKSSLFNEVEMLKQLNWKQIQNRLKSDEAVIEFVLYKRKIQIEKTTSQYAALILLPGAEHVQLIPLCSENELLEIIGETQATNKDYVQQLYGSKNTNNVALYNLLWKPIEGKFIHVKSIYYSPVGLLHKIAFSALRNERGTFLSTQYSLNNYSSLSSLVLNADLTLKSKESFLLIGGVNYDTDSTTTKFWNYLPGTLVETNALQKQLTKKKQPNYVLNGNQASETLFKDSAYLFSVLHLATHGYFYPDPETIQEEKNELTLSSANVSFRGGASQYVDWNFFTNKNPLMRSGLILAGANDIAQRNSFTLGEDGILTAQEICNLDLEQTRLVVLSACETALGDIKGSEGVYGLERAFKIAGVEQLIISLWQVPDLETAEFMQLFYKELLKTKKVKPAFLKAQSLMRTKYAPYFWAAFELVE